MRNSKVPMTNDTSEPADAMNISCLHASEGCENVCIERRADAMTAGANSLTDRAMARPGPAARRWSLPANNAREFVKALERIGYRIEPLFARAGLRVHDLDD